MEQARVERDFCAGGTTAEKVNGTALAHKLNRRFPDFASTHRFDDGVEPAGCSALPHNLNHVFPLSDINHPARAETFGRFEPRLVSAGHRHFASKMPCQRHEHKTNWTGPDHQHMLFRP